LCWGSCVRRVVTRLNWRISDLPIFQKAGDGQKKQFDSCIYSFPTLPREFKKAPFNHKPATFCIRLTAIHSPQHNFTVSAGELGYTPNRVAQSLRSKQTRTLGLIIADVENYFYSQIAKGVESVAKEAGYHVVLCNTNDDPSDEEYYLNLLVGQRVDGLIITPTSHNGRKLETLIKRGLPIVQVDRYIETILGDAVLIDNAKGAYRVVKHLIAQGHRRIGLLAGDTDVTTGRQRLRGYKQALRDHNLLVDTSLIRAGSFRRDTAEDAVHALVNLSSGIRT